MDGLDALSAAGNPAAEESPGQPDNLTDACRRLIEVRRDIDALEKALEGARHRESEREERVAFLFGEAGVQSVSLATGEQFYRYRAVYVNKRGEVSTERICSALKEHALGDLVSETYGAQTLKAVVSERIKAWLEVNGEQPEFAVAEKAVDAWIRELVNVHEQSRIGVRGAGQGKKQNGGKHGVSAG